MGLYRTVKRRKTRSRRRRKNKFWKKTFVTGALLGGGIYFVQKTLEETSYSGQQTVIMDITDAAGKFTSQVNKGFEEIQIKDDTPLIDLSRTNSANILLTNLETGDVLAEKNSNVQLYPASLTKIMTALVAIEMVDDLDKEVVMIPDYFEGLFEQEASVAGFLEDELLSFRDLLYGAILPSGADACLAIAYSLAGSEAEYVSLMNQKAEELELSKTHFSNVTGLHDPQNYSSAEDLTSLLKYALDNPDFYQVFTTVEYSTEPTNFHADGVQMFNSIFRHGEEYPKFSDFVIGAKTGFTEEAGLCLATLAEINGESYILITAGAGAQENGPDYVEILDPLHVADATMIYSQVEKIHERSKINVNE